MIKTQQTPESSLSKFYEIGQSCTFKPMTKAQIRKLYFTWLKSDEDSRPFEEIFESKFKKHTEHWKKQYSIKSIKFKPIVVGSVSLNCQDRTATLTFDSLRHQSLVISKPIKTHSELLRWVKVKVRDYATENVVTIDYEDLRNNLHTNINTTLLLF